jgi:hypothetical protein
MYEPFKYYNPVTGEIGRAQTTFDPVLRGVPLPPLRPDPLPGAMSPILGHPSPLVANGILPPRPGGY